MSGSNEILREYLIKLGYQVDLPSLSRFENSLGKTSKRLLKVGAAVSGIVAATGAATANFAYHMRKMYYSSQLANSSIQNLKGFEFAAERIGMTSDALSELTQSLGVRVAVDPGLRSFIESLGVKIEGRDTSDVVRDMMDALVKMGPLAGSQMAHIAGVSDEMFVAWTKFGEKLKTDGKLHNDVLKGMGVDIKAMEDNTKAYTDSLSLLELKLSGIGYLIMQKTMPVFKELSWALNEDFDWFASLLTTGPAKAMGTIKKYGDAIVRNGPDLKKDLAEVSKWFGSLEDEYHLPGGILDSVWAAESSRGKNTLSSAGAEGPFQLMPKTSKWLGVRDPYDLKDSSKGTAKMWSYLLNRYHGNVRMAAAAYNWGEGNVDHWLKTGTGKRGQPMPMETVKYMDKIGTNARLGSQGGASPTINQTNNITLNGGGNEITPKQVGKEINTQNIQLGRLVKSAYQ